MSDPDVETLREQAEALDTDAVTDLVGEYEAQARDAFPQVIWDAVRNGAFLLHERYGAWWDDITISSLDEEDANQCVLGQLYGSWDEGMETLFGTDDARTAKTFGFLDPEDQDRWTALTYAWREAARKIARGEL